MGLGVRIAVAGAIAAGVAGAPALASGPGVGGDADPYADAPQTTITAGPPLVARQARPTFSFTSDDPGASFECALDGGDFEACRSPFAVAALSQGTYTFRVRAVDPLTDLADPTPAEYVFTVDRNISGANAGAAARQGLEGRRLKLVVSVRAAEPVRVAASGKVRAGKRGRLRVKSPEVLVEPGARRRLILQPDRASASRRVRKALEKGKDVEAILTATFTDEVGNRATTGEIEVEIRR